MRLLCRARRAALTALAAGTLTVGAAQPAAAATPADDPQTVARLALAQKAKALQADLSRVTADYQREAARSTALDARALSARSEAATSASRLEAARHLLDRYAAAAYTHGPGGSLVDLLARHDGGEALRAAAYIEVVGESQADALTRVREEAAWLQIVQSQAAQEAQQAAALRASLAARVAQLKAQALQANTVLSGALAGLAVGPRACKLPSAATPTGRGGTSTAGHAAPTKTSAARSAAAPITAPAPTTPAAPLRAGSRVSGTGQGDVRTAGRWGGWPNGLIPPSALCPLAANPAVLLRADAAVALDRLAAAYRAGVGSPLCVGNGYRSYSQQVALYGVKPSLAAVPGTSNHGWGLAVDLCKGPDRFGTPERAWLVAHAAAYGWVSPHWAQAGSSRPEPWHWEYGVIS